MPRHETIEATLRDIISRHQKFFDELRSADQMDAYRNAFIGLHDKGVDIKHLEECFESLRQASQEASAALAKYNSKPIADIQESHETETFVGGESEFREELNRRLTPKTVARATLYNYLEDLDMRKIAYTAKDVDKMIEYIKSKKTVRNKS
jgi:hypothetical protein